MQHDKVLWKAGILVDNEVRIGLTRVFSIDYHRRAETSDVLDMDRIVGQISAPCTIQCGILIPVQSYHNDAKDMYTESAVKLMSRLSRSNRMVPTGSTTTIFQKKNHISVRDCVQCSQLEMIGSSKKGGSIIPIVQEKGL